MINKVDWYSKKYVFLCFFYAFYVFLYKFVCIIFYYRLLLWWRNFLLVIHTVIVIIVTVVIAIWSFLVFYCTYVRPIIIASYNISLFLPWCYIVDIVPVIIKRQFQNYCCIKSVFLTAIKWNINIFNLIKNTKRSTRKN